MLLYKESNTSDYHEERSLLGQYCFLVDKYYLLILAIVDYFGPHVIEIKRLTNLISPLTVNWHCFKLNIK